MCLYYLYDTCHSKQQIVSLGAVEHSIQVIYLTRRLAVQLSGHRRCKTIRAGKDRDRVDNVVNRSSNPLAEVRSRDPTFSTGVDDVRQNDFFT